MIAKCTPNVTFKTRIHDASIDGANPFRSEDKTTTDCFSGKKGSFSPCPAPLRPPAQPIDCLILKFYLNNLTRKASMTSPACRSTVPSWWMRGTKPRDIDSITPFLQRW